MGKKTTVVITGADQATGLGTARALNGMDVERIGLCTNSKARFCRSNVWERMIRISEDDSAYLSELMKIGSSLTSKAVFFPTRDIDVILLSENRAKLSEYFSFVIPDESSIERMMNKTSFHEWAVRHGFPVPESYIAESREDLDDVLGKVRYPVLLKPVVRSLKWEYRFPVDKILKIKSKAELDNIGFDLFSATPKVLVQQWVPGRDENVHFCLMYIDRKGRELEYCTGKKLLQWPLGTGSTAIGVTVYNEEVHRISSEVLKAAGLVGMGSLELKLSDLDNRYYITEPTVGRNDLQSYLAVAAGVNLTRLAFFDATGRDAAPYGYKARRAVWVEEYSAFEAIKSSYNKGEVKVKSILGGFNGKWSFANLSLSDPMPFIMLVKEVLSRSLRRLTNSKFSKLKSLINERGITSGCTYLLKYLYRNIFSYSLETYYVFELKIDRDLPVVKPGIDVEFNMVKDEDGIDELVSFWPYYFRFGRTNDELKRSIRSYFESGDECLCVKHKGKLVGMAWAGYQGNYMLKSLGRKIGLRQGEAILHRGYISEDMRGNNLYACLLTSLSNHVRKKGCGKWFAYVGIKNTASIKVHSKIADGYRMLNHLNLRVIGMTFHLFPGYSEVVKRSMPRQGR